MTKGDMEGVSIWGRPIKPVAFGLSLSMIILVVFNTADMGVLKAGMIGDVVAVMAGVSATSLIAGWILRSQKLAEAGLFVAGLTMVLRSSFLFATIGFTSIGVWLGVCTAIISLGAFLLERTDENRGQWWTSSQRVD